MRLTVSMCAVALAVWATGASAISDAQKCEAAKNKIAGKYAFCRQKAQAKAIKSGDPVDYSTCDTKFGEKWASAETDGGGMCPTSGDVTDVQDQVTAEADFIALKLAGTRFVDNGDGTVSDTETGLMWEQKQNFDTVVNLANPRDTDNIYSRADAMSEFLSLLNGYSVDGTAQAGLGGHSDWRMPTSAELQTILLAPFPCGTSPCINAAFGPTIAEYYWSSTTVSGNPAFAWFVDFSTGNVASQGKGGNLYVRAVRGGS